ncbi:MAG TPA: copper resistance CopC family protein [Blastocatellia bacterium]|nr:copper resistance CopC family protein [Blastocatellia bacterium]
MITRKLLHTLTALMFGMACLTAFDRTVAAHAVLVEATPASDSTVPGPDIDVKLRFNLRIDRTRSRLTLLRPDGQTIALKIIGNDAPDRLVARATGLMSGSYRLLWQVLAVDGHITRGELPFRVSGS